MLLLMLLNGEGRGVRFEVSGRVPVFIGRHALGLDKPDSRMSRQHAEISYENGTWLLRDLGATNGTFINGKRVKKLTELEIGDRLRCGRTEFVVADIRQPQLQVDTTSDPNDDTAQAHALVDASSIDPGDSHLSFEGKGVGKVQPGAGDAHGDRVSLLDEDEAERQDRALIPHRSRPVPALLEDDEDDEPVAPQTAAVKGDLDEHPIEAAAPVADEAPPIDAGADDEGEPDLLLEVGGDEADGDINAATPGLDDELDLDLGLELEPEPEPDAAAPAESADQGPTLDAEPDLDLDLSLDAAPEAEPDDDHVDLAVDEPAPEQDDAVEVAAVEVDAPEIDDATAPPTLSDAADAATVEATPDAVEADAATADGVSTGPTADDHDEYGAEPAVFGLSLRHAPPISPEPSPAAETDALSAEADEDSPAAEEVSDNADGPALPAIDEPAADALPPVAETGDNAGTDHPDSDSDEADELIKLGFKGDEGHSGLLEADEPALRGEVPGRFVVVDDAIDADDAFAAAEAEAEEEFAAVGADAPHARAEDSVTDESITDAESTDAANPWLEPSRSRGPSGRGRQRLPLVAVGALTVVILGAASAFVAWQRGWFPAATSSTTTVAGKTPTDDTAPRVGTVTGTPNRAAPQTAEAPTTTGRTNGDQSVFVDRPATDTPPAPITARPTTATPPKTEPSVPSPTADRETEIADATPSAVAPGLTIPAPATTPPTPAADAEPLVGTQEQLLAIIANADDAAVAKADSAPTDADPGTNKPDTFAWSGLKVGDPNNIFTAPRAGADEADVSDEQVLEVAIDSTGPAVNPTIPAPTVTGNPAAPDPGSEPGSEPEGSTTEINAAATATAALSVTPAPTPPPAAPGTVIAAAATGDVVYLVDMSGTMIDSMPQLRKYLRDQIDRLSPAQQFSVILFRQGEALELPPRGLRTATAQQKTDARQWLDADAQNIQLGGRSDPGVALQTALRYGADAVVILSDNALGRRAKAGGADIGLGDLTAVLDDHPGVTVHAVQFNYPDDRRLLQRLAKRFGGEFEFIEEVRDTNPNGPGSPNFLGGLSALP